MSADLHDPTAYDPYGDLSGNDVYLRYATSEVLSSGTNSVGENYYVLGWVTAPDPMTRERKLRVAITRDWPPWPDCVSRSHSTVTDITDVNWVQRGGHMAAGQSGGLSYPSHGYLVWSDAGREDRPLEVAVARFWEVGQGLSYERVFLERRATPTHWYWGYPVGITPYKLFRPGDNRVLYEGTLADVRDYPDYDERFDHALYPEASSYCQGQPQQFGASDNTIAAYRDCFRMVLHFAAQRLARSVFHYPSEKPGA